MRTVPEFVPVAAGAAALAVIRRAGSEVALVDEVVAVEDQPRQVTRDLHRGVTTASRGHRRRGKRWTARRGRR